MIDKIICPYCEQNNDQLKNCCEFCGGRLSNFERKIEIIYPKEIYVYILNHIGNMPYITHLRFFLIYKDSKYSFDIKYNPYCEEVVDLDKLEYNYQNYILKEFNENAGFTLQDWLDNNQHNHLNVVTDKHLEILLKIKDK